MTRRTSPATPASTSTLKLKTADVLDRLLPYTGHTPTVVDL